MTGSMTSMAGSPISPGSEIVNAAPSGVGPPLLRPVFMLVTYTFKPAGKAPAWTVMTRAGWKATMATFEASSSAAMGS